MALGYRYAERDADTQINWAEVGRNVNDVLTETVRIRQEKKDAIDAATRQFENDLANAPQGQNQDINNFTNKYAHNMMNQMRIDEQLLKSGRMPLEKYTLRRQNYVDGTNQLFELSKLYQEEYRKKMEGVTSGTLQAINSFNMSMVEGYGDFTRSEAVIDSMGDGRVNIGLYENKIIDGKSVRVLSKNIAPVNVIRGKILQNVPTFDVESTTSATVKGFGTRKDVLYDAATTAGAGSITELMGPDFLATNPDPVTQKIVNDMNDAINEQINSYFSNPYNLTSVLTQNTGKYGAESFTFDKNEAAKDENKILVKVDPNTGMTTIDKDGPNYNAQYEEASDWVRTNMLSKIDQERGIKPTAQSQLQETEAQKLRARNANDPEEIKLNQEAENFARQTSYLISGTPEQVDGSLKYFRGRGAVLERNPVGKPKGVYIENADGDLVPFKLEGKPFDLGTSMVGPLITATGSKLNDTRVIKYFPKFMKGTVEAKTSGTGVAPKRNIESEFKTKVSDQIKPSMFTGQKSTDIGPQLKEIFKDVPGIEIDYSGAGSPYNDITITYTDPKARKTVKKLNSNEQGTVAKNQVTEILKLIKTIDPTHKEKAIGPEQTGELD